MKFETADWMPVALYRALTQSNNSYEQGLKEYFDTVKGEYDFAISVTTLASPPQPRELMVRHGEKVTHNPIDNLWTMQGSMIHDIVEQNARQGDIAEKRIGRIVTIKCKEKPVRILVHGQLDLYEPDTNTLFDFKYCSPRSMMYGDKWEYTFQLNALAILFRMNYGVEPEFLKNCMIMKDWARFDFIKSAKRGYPSQPIVNVDREYWPDKYTKEMIVKLAKKHYSAMFEQDEDLPKCSSDEQWRKPKVFKVHTPTKSGAISKVARASVNSMDEALEYLSEKNIDPKDADIRVLESKATRCQEFCPAAPFCHQFKHENQEQLNQKEDNQDNE